MNSTIIKFGYPETLLKEFEYWVVLLRPKQITIGSLVLACKENSESFGEVSIEAYTELKTIIKELEFALEQAFDMDKINYLALMMVDKEVHFHVIPRYSSIRRFNKTDIEDVNWPKPPNLSATLKLSNKEFSELKNFLISKWPK